MRAAVRRSASVLLLFVAGLSLPLQSPVLAGRDASPARRTQPDPKKYVGEYDLMGQTIKVAVNEGKTLTVTVPGQPTYDLEPIEGKPHEFKLKIPGGLEGFSLVFTMEGERATEAVFHQPNGVFAAKRKHPAADGAKPQTNEEFVREFRVLVGEAAEAFRVPGVAVAVVRDGEVIFAEGFGFRDAEQRLPVTEHTLFAIGSSSKAFTTTVLATLVDEGKLDWDKPVRDYWPGFRLKDEVAAARLTPRDLVTHRTGWPRHDLAWYGSSADRDELMRRLAFLEPSADIRQKFQYNNFMIVAAGYAAQQVTGKTWEDLVRERIFEPLGMGESNFSVSRMTGGDCAIGYRKKESAIERVPYRNIDAMGPAGSINSSAADMACWVRLHLNKGRFGGRQVVSEAQVKQLHAPQVVIDAGASPIPRPEEILAGSYGLGWFVAVYRGHVLVEHGGNIDGFSALVTMLPEDGIGVVVLANRDGVLGTDAIAHTAFDRLLGLPAIDWVARRKLMQEQLEQLAEAQVKGDPSERVAGTSPSHRSEDYAGTFWNDGYGGLDVSWAEGKLSLTLNGISSALEHWHYDTFRATDEKAEGMKVSFQTNVRGDIDKAVLAPGGGSPPVTFTRRAEAALADPQTLARYVGEYDLKGVVVTVALRGATLTVTVPGQPTYDLKPVKADIFDIVLPGGIEGFSMRFTMEEGSASEATFVQPNGTFVAKRKKA